MPDIPGKMALGSPFVCVGKPKESVQLRSQEKSQEMKCCLLEVPNQRGPQVLLFQSTGLVAHLSPLFLNFILSVSVRALHDSTPR